MSTNSKFFLIIILFCFFILACTPKEGDHWVNRDEAVEIAKKEARTIGYPVDRMDITSDRQQGIYEVYFAPQGEVLGGDVTIYVDSDTGKVVKILRGR